MEDSFLSVRLIAALAALAVVWALAEFVGARPKWGVVRERIAQRGDGAFRTAAVTEERPRGVPSVVAFAGPVGMVAGLVAPWVCVPVTMDLMFAAITHPYDDIPLALWFGVLTSGLLAGQCLFLIRGARMVLRCQRGAGDTAALTGVVGALVQVVAHVGVIAQGTLSTPAAPVVMLLSITLILANFALMRAGEATRAVQSQMTDEEWYALPDDDI
ncbi:MAG: hypothetical protein AB8I08_32585 [Sandaracinaceae bacterium]